MAGPANAVTTAKGLRLNAVTRTHGFFIFIEGIGFVVLDTDHTPAAGCPRSL